MCNIEHDILFINGVEKKFYLIDYIDGKKEEVNVDNGELLLFYQYCENYELWYYIKSTKETIKKYLEGKIGILSLMRCSNLYMVKRYYVKFDLIDEFYVVNLSSLQLPAVDVKFGNNIYKIIQNSE